MSNEATAGPARRPLGSTRGLRSMVVTADQLATQAGMAAITLGGTAVDAAIAANAVLTVTAPHLCGMGGDLFALVHTAEGAMAVNGSGRAGTLADADALRSAGHRAMPFRHDVRTVTVPGCVDGWILLHERLGTLPLPEVLAPAIRLAERGFPASPLLVAALGQLDRAGRSCLSELVGQATRTGDLVVRPGVGRALRAVATQGREGFYGGEFGAGLLRLASEVMVDDDLERPHAEWVEPLSTSALGMELHTVPPNSQGYLVLGACRLIDGIPLPEPEDPAWAHLLIEAAVAAGHDRPAVLHEHADGRRLLADIDRRRAWIGRSSASGRQVPRAHGDTTYLCCVDDRRMAVSLIQSNASGFGSWLVEPSTGINLHNRGLGFSLEAGHPAEYGPGRRPPHTLSPLLVTSGDELTAVLGTMGGDAQPQILLQVLARLLAHRHSAARAVDAGRWVLRGASTGFDTWADPARMVVALEGHVPASWRRGLLDRGHEVRVGPAYDAEFGHAHTITVDAAGTLSGCADPRTIVGSAAAL